MVSRKTLRLYEARWETAQRNYPNLATTKPRGWSRDYWNAMKGRMATAVLRQSANPRLVLRVNAILRGAGGAKPKPKPKPRPPLGPGDVWAYVMCVRYGSERESHGLTIYTRSLMNLKCWGHYRMLGLNFTVLSLRRYRLDIASIPFPASRLPYYVEEEGSCKPQCT